MSLKKNIIASYFSQVYVAVIGIVILPLFIKTMGAEAYGLIGFFTMLQAWFVLLDLGLTPTISRETARYRAGTMSALEYRQLFRALSLIFLIIAVLGGGGLWLFAHSIATQWLSFSTLSEGVVVAAVEIMSASIALRWMGGLYRGVIAGSERIAWLSGFNIVIATLRFVAVLLTMWLYGYTPAVFFIHQLVVAIIEVIGLLLMGRSLLPDINKSSESVGWSFKPVSPFLKFAMSIAFTSFVWVLVTQVDKLILSGILPLADYGHFTLGVLVAGAVMVLSGPVSNAIMPRMAKLHAQEKYIDLVDVYRSSTQFLAILAGAASITLAVCAQPLLMVWTGDAELAAHSAPILSLYALGNGLLVMAAFPYYLQYAKGDLTFHVLGNTINIILLVPSLIWAALKFGGVGAGVTWLAINAFLLFFWVTYVHYRIERNLHWSWLLNDCLRIILPTALVAFLAAHFMAFSEHRFLALMQIFFVGFVALLTAIFSSGRAIDIIVKKVRGWYA